MMKMFFSWVLTLALILPSLTPLSAQAAPAAPAPFNPAKTCAQGQCVDRMVGLLTSKMKTARADRCLPPAGTKDEKAWFQSHPISTSCFKQLQEIRELSDNLQKVENYLASQAEKGNCPNCEKGKSPVGDILGNLQDIDKVKAVAACTPEKKRQVMNNCANDTKCIMLANAATMAGPLADKLLGSAVKGCSSKDNCLNQLAHAFVKAVWGLFTGMWDLLKMTGSAAKKGITNLWNWAAGAEKKSSTSQLAAAKASEDEGVFSMLKKDFPGTMAKIWGGLLGAIKEWLASSVFCQEWSGRPQFSTCKKPAEGFGCTSCKAMATGMCALTGTFVAEVVPAFLTGGLLTAAKYGAQGAVKLAKLFKVSDATMKAVKSSKLATMASHAGSTATAAVKASTAAKVAVSATQVALSALRKFLVSPVMKGARVTLKAMKDASMVGAAYLVVTPAGKYISFGGKVLKGFGKAVIYPIENPMTQKAFTLGQNSFDKAIRIGAGKVVNPGRTVLAAEAARPMGLIDQHLADLKTAESLGDKGAAAVAQEKYLRVLKEQRGAVIGDYLAKHPETKFSDLVDEFYPELKYGAVKASPEDIEKAEREIFAQIRAMKNPTHQSQMAAAYQNHIASTSRKTAVPAKSFTADEQFANAALSTEDKAEAAIKLVNAPRSVNKDALEAAISETQKLGPGVLRLEAADLDKQSKILMEAGLTPKQADEVIKAGLAGSVNPQDQFANLRSVAIPKGNGLVEEMSKSQDYGKIILGHAPERRPAMARAIRVFENGGMQPGAAASTFKRFEPTLTHVQKIGGKDSDAAALLAEYIRRQKAAGVADNVIQKDLEKAFGVCK